MHMKVIYYAFDAWLTGDIIVHFCTIVYFLNMFFFQWGDIGVIFLCSWNGRHIFIVQKASCHDINTDFSLCWKCIFHGQVAFHDGVGETMDTKTLIKRRYWRNTIINLRRQANGNISISWIILDKRLLEVFIARIYMKSQRSGHEVWAICY